MSSRLQEIVDIAVAVSLGGIPLMLFSLGYMTLLTADTPAHGRLGIFLLIAGVVAGVVLFLVSTGSQ